MRGTNQTGRMGVIKICAQVIWGKRDANNRTVISKFHWLECKIFFFTITKILEERKLNIYF